MPNMSALKAAPDLLATTPVGTRPYGRHCTISIPGDGSISLHAGTLTLASVTAGGQPRANLRMITPLTSASVNAFLRPYGSIKVDWRARKADPSAPTAYVWRAASGRKSAPAPRKSAPKRAAAPKAAPPAAPVAPTAPVPAPVAPVAVTVPATPDPTGPAPVWTVPAPAHPAKVEVGKRTAKIGAVFMPVADHATARTAWSIRSTGRPAAILITGPAGTAKSRFAAEFAASCGVPFLNVDCQTIQTATDWYGERVQGTDGIWRWEWSDLAKAIIAGQPCVINLDELNRVESTRALGGIMGLLDWKQTVSPTGAPHPLRLPAGIMFTATLNEGPEFVGTVEVDAAVRDRFAWGVRTAYVDERVETQVLLKAAPGLDKEVAKRLVRVAATQRAKRHDDTLYPSGNVISTRVLIDVALAVTVANMPPVEAIWSAARARFWPEDEAHLRVCIEAQFGATPEALADDPDEDEIERLLAAI